MGSEILSVILSAFFCFKKLSNCGFYIYTSPLILANFKIYLSSFV